MNPAPIASWAVNHPNLQTNKYLQAFAEDALDRRRHQERAVREYPDRSFEHSSEQMRVADPYPRNREEREEKGDKKQRKRRAIDDQAASSVGSTVQVDHQAESQDEQPHATLEVVQEVEAGPSQPESNAVEAGPPNHELAAMKAT